MSARADTRPADCRCAGSSSGPGLFCQACRARWAAQARAGVDDRAAVVDELAARREDRARDCGRCGNAPGIYPGLDPARGLFCRACADRCHESTDVAHICQVCASPDERYP